MSAAELRQAADLIAKYALDANDSGSPWSSEWITIYGGDGEVIAHTQDGRAACMWEAEWIALMHPGIATPLVAWLRSEALIEQMGTGADLDAITFARAILREDGRPPGVDSHRRAGAITVGCLAVDFSRSPRPPGARHEHHQDPARDAATPPAAHRSHPPPQAAHRGWSRLPAPHPTEETMTDALNRKED